ncbi:MAG: DUF4870 domain-containing protein [Patescibacteria group bacterium]|jgi:uncharacterized membrane protein|nr:hypothetical protein [Patescibacteria group bacterium]
MAEEEVKEAPKASQKQENIGMAIIAYFIFFIPLLTDSKDDPFVKFHVKQSIVILITSVIVWLLGMFIPIIGWFLIAPIGGLLVFVLWVIGVVNAAQQKKTPVPIVGKFAEKLNF